MTRVVFLIPTPLRPFADGQSRIQVDVAKNPPSLGDALDALWGVAPGVRDRVLTEQGEVRPHVNVYVDSERAELGTALGARSRVDVIAAISGG